VTHHEHVATTDSVAVVRRAEGTYATPMGAGYHLVTRHAATLVPADEYATLANQHAPWAPDQTVTEGSKRAHAGLLYECAQAHTPQADWAPDLTPALWRMIPAEGVIWPWAQPQGAHDAYPVGARVTHNGSLWESLIPANATEPGSDPRWWKNLSEPEPDPNEPQPWKPWDGHNSSLYQVGDRVTHNGQTWTATVGNNHWEPGAPGTASLWVAD
jgi:hypothetical protein